jgi:outer membrane receptor protein involved in Fe transport
MRAVLPLRFLLLCLLTGTAVAESSGLAGTVRDPKGVPIAAVAVTLHSVSGTSSTTTDSAGQFSFAPVPKGALTLTFIARGYAPAERTWSLEHTEPLEIVLHPLRETVLVTAARVETRLDETPGSSLLLSYDDLRAAPALMADDVLRQVPGFTLFRRNSSRFLNPTSQGVSLRGIGASGASRALVLVDGVPLNDPFGGWVYWSRVPRQALASVEVAHGGTSDLYGSDALGGTVQFLTRQPESPAVSLETSYGNQKTPDLSLWTGSRFGRWDAEVNTDLFHSDGYILVPPSQHGTVDTPANAEHAALDLNLGRRVGAAGRIFARGAFFDEYRHNGTIVQTNGTQTGQGVLGFDTQSARVGTVALRFFGTAQSYDQTFSSVSTPDRNSEFLTNRQHVPSQMIGGSAQWSRSAGSHQTFVAGVDADETQGTSLENLFNASGAHTFFNTAGGHQRTVGIFGEDILHLSPSWIMALGMRYDHWRNFDASKVSTKITPSAPPVFTPQLDRTESAFSPRLSVLHHFNHNLALTVSGYRSFRAPTLNELYRSFRVGNVLTVSNDALNAERLTGGEGGLTAKVLGDRLILRGNFFWSDVVNPIANVTINKTPSLTTRQRQNLGRTRSRGVAFDGLYRLSSRVQFSGGYQFVDASVFRFPQDTTLEGNALPQVPHHQFTLQARYWNPRRVMLSVQGRYSGGQFDDDLNQLLLDRYFTVDLFAGRELGHGIEVFGAFENLFNTRYNVSLTPTATTPTRTQGPPILGRVGLRFNFPAR